MATTVFNRTVSRKQPTAGGERLIPPAPAIHAGKTVFATSPCAAASNRRATVRVPAPKSLRKPPAFGPFSALSPAASATGVVSIRATSPNPFLIKEEGLGLGVLNKHRLIANHFRTVDVSPLSRLNLLPFCPHIARFSPSLKSQALLPVSAPGSGSNYPEPVIDRDRDRSREQSSY